MKKIFLFFRSVVCVIAFFAFPILAISFYSYGANVIGNMFMIAIGISISLLIEDVLNNLFGIKICKIFKKYSVKLYVLLVKMNNASLAIVTFFLIFVFLVVAVILGISEISVYNQAIIMTIITGCLFSFYNSYKTIIDEINEDIEKD